MSSPKLTLYTYWRSSAAWRVRIILAYKGIEYTSIPISLLAGANKDDKYTALNPMAQLPCLVVEEEGKEPLVLNQSMVIIEYLEATYPEKSLKSSDFPAYLKAQEYALDVVSGIHPLQNLGVITEVQRLTGDENARAEFARKWIVKGLTALEAKAAKTAGDYLVGNEVSIADVCLIPQLYNARRFNVDLSVFPTLLRAEANCEKLDYFQAAHPNKQPDATL